MILHLAFGAFGSASQRTVRPEKNPGARQRT